MTVTCRPAYFQPDRVRCWLLGVCTGLLLIFSVAPATQTISFTVARIEGAEFRADGIHGTVHAGADVSLELRIDEVALAGDRFRNVRIRCPVLKQDRDVMHCVQGTIESPQRIPLEFSYAARDKHLDLTLAPADNERWRLQLSAKGGAPVATLTVNEGQLSRLSAWWPDGAHKPKAGTVSGRVLLQSGKESTVEADVTLAGYAFADASGLHAGEKIVIDASLRARQRGERWMWQGQLTWKGGDVFWDPVFVSGGGHQLQFVGNMDGTRVQVEQGQLVYPGVAQVNFDALYDRASARVSSARARSVDIDVAALYEKSLKPVLQGTVLGDLRVEGRVDLALEIRDSVLAAVDAQFKRVSLDDRARRFALFGLSGSLPWRRDRASTSTLSVDGGELLRLPFGAFELPLDFHGYTVAARDLKVPLLDGHLVASEFVAAQENDAWRWRFKGGLTPVSMERFTSTLGLPVMQGTLSAEIPAVTYQRSTISVDGALQFNVFDGVVTARNLVLESPFGKVPRLLGDVEMRNLDLDLLTRRFSFGSITGRVEGQLAGLEMVNWQPVRFDARIVSSKGEYPRRISQAAVQNISSLGGAGAAAAIQRSFLRFFETFGYSQLGLSCKLEAGVCRMGGIQDTPEGYVMIRGGGIPAINVLGYNRNVGWRELIERLKRVTEGNVIVQ